MLQDQDVSLLLRKRPKEAYGECTLVGSQNSASSFSILVSKLFPIYITANIFFQQKLQLGGVCEKMI